MIIIQLQRSSLSPEGLLDLKAFLRRRKSSQCIPFYFIFSEWIFILSFLFYFDIIPFNPIYLIFLALTTNVFMLFYMIYLQYINKLKNKVVIKKQILNIFIEKLIPLYLVYNKPVSTNDLYFTFITMIVYVLFMELMNKNFIDLYSYLSKSIIDNKNVLPVYYLYDKIFK